MTELTCAAVAELLPELALGSLPGDARADVVAHLAGCAGCRHTAEELSELVDSLLLLAPEAEPPAGFESRVLARIGIDQLGRRRRTLAVRALSVAAVVIVVVAAAAGIGLGRHSARPNALTREYVAALASLGGKSLASAPLVGPGGEVWGQAFVYQGKPSWVFVSMDWRGAGSETYRVELADAAASPPLVSDSLRLAAGRGSFGMTIPAAAANATVVRVVDRDGHEVCRATVDRA